MSGSFFFAEHGTRAVPGARLNEGLALVHLLGGVDADAGDRRSYGVVLDAGRYALEFSTDGPSQYREILVEGAAGAEAPAADATITWSTSPSRCRRGCRQGRRPGTSSTSASSVSVRGSAC